MSAIANTLLSQCLGDGALADAWARVQANDGCAGVDGVTLEDFRASALSSLAGLRTEVFAGLYRPQPLLGVEIPKRNGRMRRLAIPTVRDRVLQTCVARRLTELLDPEFDEASFAYRSGRSVRQATTRIVDCRDLGLRWVVDADIRDYFDSIDHTCLLSALRRRLPDGSLIALLARWLAAPVFTGGVLQPRRQGVPQGSPVSPLLANLYLHPLDTALSAANLHEVRYADDLLVLCATRAQAEGALELLRNQLALLHLEVNEEKIRVTHFEAGFRFLGVRFEGSQVSAVEAEAAPWVMPDGVAGVSQTLESAAPSTSTAAMALDGSAETAPDETPVIMAAAVNEQALELLDPEAVLLDGPAEGVELPRSLYVITQGVRVTKAGEQLMVSRGQDVIARVPLRQLDQIVIHGNALVSTAIVRFCHERGLGLEFADANGVHAVALDTGREGSLALLKAQVARDQDDNFHLLFARDCVEGKLRNCRAVLQRFSRRESPEKVGRAIGILARSLRRLPMAGDLNVVRGIEGRAAAAYFAALETLVPPAWGFSGRNRRPPQDPVNALLSYGYAVLSNVVRTAVMLARLHPGFGHLHAFVPGRPALVCDLMEEFRPLVVDAVVLTLARGHTLRPERDFVVSAEGCRIESAAKQVFIARLEAKLAAAVRHDQGQTSLHRLIRRQAERYAHAVAGGDTYHPYLAQ